MSFLVTGGTGFIGSYVVRCLLEHGQQVVSLNRTPDPEVTRLFTSNVEVITGDVSDRAQLAAIFGAIRKSTVSCTWATSWGLSPRPTR